MVPRKHRDGGPAQGQAAAGGQGLAKPDDLLVMGTNNSSIVSKRSVERLYYPDEPHFFRFFVPKVKRRSPLINRGYFFRIHLIDVTLRNFLTQPSSWPSPTTKVVVNLGCGSDVIPWQCWTRYPECRQSKVHFVDVDFPELIRKKRQVVLNTPELHAHLSDVDSGDALPNVLLRSNRYTQIGVDLRDIAALETALAAVLPIKDCHFLFIAEVSITYMETCAADNLIQWAATVGQAAEFCLLEQILPDGPSHPFATTMLQHFDKLSCPIKSVAMYSTIPQQRERFRRRGWPITEAQSLWSAWSGESFLTPREREQLDRVEPFDEHEEFALFASHYLLLHARNYGDVNTPSEKPLSSTPKRDIEAFYSQLTGLHGLRRFGAAMSVRDHFGNESIVNCLGLGSNNRLSSYDVYTQGDSSAMHIKPPGGPSSRMCATLTDLGHNALLIGGRSSPAKPMSDCWIFRKETKEWTRTHELSAPVHRHSACRLGSSSLALVLGGRTRDSGVSELIAVYHPDDGWLECSIRGSTLPKLVFGAILTCSGPKPTSHSVFGGYVAGGLSADGIIDNRVLAWTLCFDNDKRKPTIFFTEAKTRGDDTVSLLSRFGAACVQGHDFFILLGGIGCDGLISREDDIVVFSTTGSKIEASTRLVLPLTTQIPRPLIVGSSVVISNDRDLVLLGGSCTCFSMGTFWTRGVYTLRLPLERLDDTPVSDWHYSHTGEIVQTPPKGLYPTLASPHAATVTPIKRVKLCAELSFEHIMAQCQPAVLEGLNIGPCTANWSLDHLTNQIGSDRKVVVHESSCERMDFNAKNFRYTTMDFGDFAEQVKDGKRLYLRSLSVDAPTNKPASLEQDFPGLGLEFVFPDELKICGNNMHSSILRISGPVNMWLHFDVQANIYCQIGGSKRMLLFPPSDVTRLSFAPGASSSSFDVFGSIDSPALAETHPMEAELRPGDVLYLPPLWLHTAAPTSDISIAVNVFFRNLDPDKYAEGRDIYGNKDLAAYDKGRQDVKRIVHSFAKLPGSYKQFYLLRLADELTEMAKDLDP